MTKREKALALINKSQQLTFLTGAGVSVASGIPDYRSLNGLYQGLDEPEYLLSHSCLMAEPQKFYAFVRRLYYSDAEPNVIHRKMRDLADRGKTVKIVTQNIDQLHQKAGSPEVLNFHGNLYDVYCMNCQKKVSADVYLASDRHADCGGQLRPDVVLYEEGLDQQVMTQSIQAVASAELVVVVGTSFKVYPFAGLLQYVQPKVPVIVINKEEISVEGEHLLLTEDAVAFFRDL